MTLSKQDYPFQKNFLIQNQKYIGRHSFFVKGMQVPYLQFRGLCADIRLGIRLPALTVLGDRFEIRNTDRSSLLQMILRRCWLVVPIIPS